MSSIETDVSPVVKQQAQKIEDDATVLMTSPGKSANLLRADAKMLEADDNETRQQVLDQIAKLNQSDKSDCLPHVSINIEDLGPNKAPSSLDKEVKISASFSCNFRGIMVVDNHDAADGGLISTNEPSVEPLKIPELYGILHPETNYKSESRHFELNGVTEGLAYAFNNWSENEIDPGQHNSYAEAFKTRIDEYERREAVHHPVNGTTEGIEYFLKNPESFASGLDPGVLNEVGGRGPFTR